MADYTVASLGERSPSQERPTISRGKMPHDGPATQETETILTHYHQQILEIFDYLCWRKKNSYTGDLGIEFGCYNKKKEPTLRVTLTNNSKTNVHYSEKWTTELEGRHPDYSWEEKELVLSKTLVEQLRVKALTQYGDGTRTTGFEGNSHREYGVVDFETNGHRDFTDILPRMLAVPGADNGMADTVIAECFSVNQRDRRVIIAHRFSRGGIGDWKIVACQGWSKAWPVEVQQDPAKMTQALYKELRGQVQSAFKERHKVLGKVERLPPKDQQPFRTQFLHNQFDRPDLAVLLRNPPTERTELLRADPRLEKYHLAGPSSSMQMNAMAGLPSAGVRGAMPSVRQTNTGPQRQFNAGFQGAMQNTNVSNLGHNQQQTQPRSTKPKVETILPQRQAPGVSAQIIIPQRAYREPAVVSSTDVDYRIQHSPLPDKGHTDIDKQGGAYRPAKGNPAVVSSTDGSTRLEDLPPPDPRFRHIKTRDHPYKPEVRESSDVSDADKDMSVESLALNEPGPRSLNPEAYPYRPISSRPAVVSSTDPVLHGSQFMAQISSYYNSAPGAPGQYNPNAAPMDTNHSGSSEYRTPQSYVPGTYEYTPKSVKRTDTAESTGSRHVGHRHR